MSAQPAPKKRHWRCADCGSDEILHDATAAWNPDTGQYELVTVFDEVWCETCMLSDDSNKGQPKLVDA